jgi:hypothetical protein
MEKIIVFRLHGRSRDEQAPNYSQLNAEGWSDSSEMFVLKKESNMDLIFFLPFALMISWHADMFPIFCRATNFNFLIGVISDFAYQVRFIKNFLSHCFKFLQNVTALYKNWPAVTQILQNDKNKKAGGSNIVPPKV